MSILAKLKAFFESTETEILTVLTPFEHQLLQEFHALFQQIEKNGAQQLLDVTKTALATTMDGLAAGESIGAAIAQAAPAALKQLEADAKEDAKNAVYGVLAAASATLPATK